MLSSITNKILHIIDRPLAGERLERDIRNNAVAQSLSSSSSTSIDTGGALISSLNWVSHWGKIKISQRSLALWLSWTAAAVAVAAYDS